MKASLKNSESGTAMIEMAICLPLLLLLIIIIVDLTCLIINYSVVKQSLREGLRAATRYRDLEEGSENDIGKDEETVTKCYNPDAHPEIKCGHVTVQSRVRLVLEEQAPFGVPREGEGAPIITSFYDRNADMVQLEISAVYLGFFNTYDIGASAAGPYLH